jgi:hypothetical protein
MIASAIRPARGDGHHDPRRERQHRLRTVLPVELRELRHQAEHHQTHHDDRQRHEHRGIDERGHHLRPDAREHLDVLHVPAHDLLEAAALFAGHQRGRVHAGKEPLGFEGLRERAAGAHPPVDVIERRPERGVRHPLPKDVERLHERQSRLEQRGQLLVEDEELGRGYAAAARHAQPDAREPDAPRAMDRQQVQALLLQLVPEAGLVFGDEDGLRNLPTGGRDPAPKLHAC